MASKGIRLFFCDRKKIQKNKGFSLINFFILAQEFMGFVVALKKITGAICDVNEKMFHKELFEVQSVYLSVCFLCTSTGTSMWNTCNQHAKSLGFVPKKNSQCVPLRPPYLARGQFVVKWFEKCWFLVEFLRNCIFLVEVLRNCRFVVEILKNCRFLVDVLRNCIFLVEILRNCRFLVEILKNCIFLVDAYFFNKRVRWSCTHNHGCKT